MSENKDDTIVKWTGKVSPASQTPTIDEIIQFRKNMQTMHIEEAMEFILPMFFGYCAQAGFIFADPEDEEYDLTGDKFFKDGILVTEALRSMLMKYYNIEHPLQQVADAMVEITEDGNFVIASRIETASYKITANGAVIDTKG